MLPNGLIDDSLLVTRSIWGGVAYSDGGSLVRDSIYAFMVVTFGYIVIIPAAVVSGIAVSATLLRGGGFARQQVLFFLPIVVILFFLDGASIVQFQKAIFTGLGFAFAFPVGELSLKRRPGRDAARS